MKCDADTQVQGFERWSTPVDYPPLSPSQRGRYADRCITLGSCFSDHIGAHLYRLGYDIQINPFGTLYNPRSIAQAIDILLEDKTPDWRTQLIEHDGVWFSPMHHSRYHDTDAEALVQRLDTLWQEAHKRILSARWLMITLGTSHYASERSSQRVVANCHKIPASQFAWSKMSAQEVVGILSQSLSRLSKRVPDIEVIISVSPVRYLHYGLAENMLSKATLRVAVEELSQTLDNVHYFPAFEILNDELRDYRFYASDLVHPSEVAVEYVAERFLDFWSDPCEKQIRQKAVRLRKLAEHRPIVSENYNKLKQQIEEKRLLLEKDYPSVIVSHIIDPSL